MLPVLAAAGPGGTLGLVVCEGAAHLPRVSSSLSQVLNHCSGPESLRSRDPKAVYTVSLPGQVSVDVSN